MESSPFPVICDAAERRSNLYWKCHHTPDPDYFPRYRSTAVSERDRESERKREREGERGGAREGVRQSERHTKTAWYETRRDRETEGETDN